MTFPETVSILLSRLWAAGFESYAVGGCVRDSVMGRVPHDWDLTTAALPEEVQAVFDVPGFRVLVGNGLKHGTVTVARKSDPHGGCEITTFRTEGAYSDHRRPDSVAFVRSVREDLSRRDFTINAMAACPAQVAEPERFVDLFGGRADISAGVIRCVGEPEQRFNEDALRILRGIRFASRFGFTVEEKTASAMLALAPTLAEIAVERIGEEVRGILAGPSCGSQIVRFAPIFRRLLPGCAAEEAEELFAGIGDGFVRLTLLTHTCAPKQIRSLLTKYGFGLRTAERVSRTLLLQSVPLETRGQRCAVAAGLEEEDTRRYFIHRRRLEGDSEALRRAEEQTLALFAPGEC